MSRIIVFILLVCACTVHAQTNYVLNPSFEQYKRCPTDVDQIRCANNWNEIDTTDIDPGCSPEYCNICAAGSNVGIPSGGWYTHYPRTGNGVVEVSMYFDESFPSAFNRDYLQGKLYTPLTGGLSYCVTFYVTLCQASQYAVNHIGVYIDDGSIDIGQDSVDCSMPKTAYTPQVVETTIINDTLNWIQVQGNFVATGTEAFITIGNFFDKMHVATILLHGTSPSGLYLIDDVSVIESSTVADAGPDAAVSPGSDSAWIGPHEEGWPCKWRIAGDTTVISVYTGFKVHPDTTTRYVMELDLCDNVTFDTVVVYVAPAGVPFDRLTMTQINIFPNPTSGVFTVEHAKGTTIVVYDVYGSARLIRTITDDKELIDISSLANGVYSVVIKDPQTKERTMQMLIKAR